MASSSQLFKDDEAERVNGVPSDEELRHLTGISPEAETAMDDQAAAASREHLANQEKGLYNSEGDNKSDSDSNSSLGGLAAAEGAASGIGQLGKGFTSGPGGILEARLRVLLSRHKRKALIGGGAGGLLITVLVAVLFFLIPLKIEAMVTKLESHFMASSQNAISQQSHTILEKYIEKKVIPGYNKCGTTTSKACSALNSTGTDPVSRLYNDWRNQRFENTLADKYGIELKKNSDGTWELKAPGTNGDNIGADGQNLESDFNRADRSEMRAAFDNVTAQETKWKQVFNRYKYGRLLEEKYGIKRCLIYCGVSDPLAKNIAEQKLSAQLFLTDRVITPRNKTLGVALTCILSPDCDPTKTSSSADGAAENGEAKSAVEKEVSQNFQDLATKFGLEDAKALQDAYTKIADSGLQKYIITEVLSQFVKDTTAKNVADKIPYVGWLNLAAQIENKANTAGPSVKKLAYVTNAAAAVSLFAMYQTYANEIHTGHVSATEVGSMVSSLGPGNSGSANDAEVGGTASAEGAPLYNSLMNDSQPSSSSTIASTLGSNFLDNASAATTGTTTASPDYKCNDGKGIPKGDTVCPEEVLGSGNNVLNSIHSFLNTPPGNVINTIAAVWNDTIGLVFHLISWIGSKASGVINIAFSTIAAPYELSCSIPVLQNYNPFCTNKGLVKKSEQTIMTGLTNFLIPNPFSSNMSGGRKFDMMAAGADVSGNDSAHRTLGGQALTPTQTATIENQQNNIAAQAFSHKPFFARMFSTSDPMSLVSKIAIDLPINTADSSKTFFGGILSNPFSVLAHSFGSLFSSHAVAAQSAQPDPFGVTQYGYPSGTIPSDPEAYWNQYCSDGTGGALTQAWNSTASSTPDPNTGMPENKGTDPCLLIQATVGSLGGTTDSSLLTSDDLANLNGSSSGSTATASSPTTGPGCGGSGKYASLVGSGSSFAGVDQGIDFVPSSSGGFDICAPAPGTITLADQTGHHFNRTSGQAEIIEKLDQTPNAPSSSQYIYYAEIIQINSNIHVGGHVNKGDKIGHSDQSPGIEVGWGPNAAHGFMCPIGYPTPCGTSFDTWVQAQ